ncbi:phosphomethylpyrimidine synthase ThiC, partial [Staphylococcus hominis]|uniref:phosphomethylpyrimidine synthase ThiC n=1 Tax=Staphylococcus hominis TaxID=1290 RepID=UPI001643E50C
KTLPHLTHIPSKYNLQVIIQPPPHIPIHKIKQNQHLPHFYSKQPPFYTLPPLLTHIPPPYHHITSPIPPPQIPTHPTAILSYLTPKQHLPLPNKHHLREALLTYKIPPHPPDLSKPL